MIPNLEAAQRLSERILAARRTHRQAEHALAVLLHELAAKELFRPLGYVSVEEYGAALLEISARQTRELIRIGRALPRLPPDPEEMDRLAPERRLFSVRMEASDYDTLRAAIAALRLDLTATEEELEDGDLLGRIVEHWLHMRTEAAGSSGERYRVTIEHCPTCRQSQLPDAEVSDTVQAEAACDAEIVELRPGPRQGHVTRTIPPATRRLVLGRAKWRCEVPDCRNRLLLDIHHIQGRATGGTHDPGGLVCICDGHHRAVHRGYLAIERDKAGSVRVRRATHVGRNSGSRATLERAQSPGDGPPPAPAVRSCETAPNHAG